jgi:hypothetical protein
MHTVDEQRGIGRLKVNKTFLIFSNEALYDRSGPSYFWLQ